MLKILRYYNYTIDGRKQNMNYSFNNMYFNQYPKKSLANAWKYKKFYIIMLGGGGGGCGITQYFQCLAVFERHKNTSSLQNVWICDCVKSKAK